MELNGYNAVGFVDPLDFLQAINTQTPNLIVLDLMRKVVPERQDELIILMAMLL